jgi:hypothetical protein
MARQCNVNHSDQKNEKELEFRRHVHPGCDALQEEYLQEYPKVFNWQEGQAIGAERHGREVH